MESSWEELLEELNIGKADPLADYLRVVKEVLTNHIIVLLRELYEYVQYSVHLSC